LNRYAGPFWAYDAQIIQARIAQLQAFDVVRFAQKSTPVTGRCVPE
jgi:diaminopimelate decarboxylase